MDNKNNFIKRNSTSGLTLIEVIVVLAILGVVLATIYSINAFGLRSFSLTNRSADSQFETLMASDFIIKNVRFADQVEILSSVPTGAAPAGAHDIYLDSGEIKYKIGGIDKNIIGTDDKTNYTLTFEKKTGTYNVIVVKVGKVGSTTFDILTDLIILNSKQSSILGATSGIGIRYYIDKAESVTPVSITGIATPSSEFVDQNGIVSLPSRVTASMSDSTTRQVAVRWSPSSIDTSTAGVKLSTGSVVGYSGSVSFTAIVGNYTVIRIDPIPIIDVEAIEGQSYTPPTTVPAMIEVAGVEQGPIEIPVSWESEVDTSIVGEQFIAGTVEDLGLIPNLLRVEVVGVSIVSINDINVTVNQGVTYIPPTTVAANMSNGSIFNLPVTWTPSGALDTSTAGMRTAQGNVDGYGSVVNLTLTVNQTKVPTPVGTIMTSGNAGVVKVNGTIGATATLRKSNGQSLGTGVIGSTGEITINGINTSILYDVILTKTGWLQSDPYLF